MESVLDLADAARLTTEIKKVMKNLIKPAVLAAVTAALVWLPLQTQAQGQGGGGRRGNRGNFDPAQMRQRMMDNFRENLGVKSDDEWAVIEPRIQKVMDTQRETRSGMGMRGMFGFGGRRGGPPGGADAQNADQGQNQRRRNFGPQPSPAAQALEQAITSNASSETIKAKLDAYRAERKQNEAKLEEARTDLKKVLSLKQEAQMVMAGLLE